LPGEEQRFVALNIHLSVNSPHCAGYLGQAWGLFFAYVKQEESSRNASHFLFFEQGKYVVFPLTFGIGSLYSSERIDK
jgi:hypothetical protein